MSKGWKTTVHNVKRWVFDNWPIKLTALALAAILWAAVATQEETTHLVAVNLEVLPPEGRTLTGELPPVHALYAGTARELLKLYVRPPSIRASLPDTITGSEYTLELSVADLVISNGAAIRAQRIEPRTITVQLDDVVEQVVRVTHQVIVHPDSGYQMFGPVTVSPAEITIRGPKEQVERVEAVSTVPLVLERVSAPVRRDVAIDTSPLGTVQLSVTSVQIFADIGALSERVLMGVPVVLRTDLPGQWSSDPAAVLVTVRGRTSRLARLTRDSVLVYAVFDEDRSDSFVLLQLTPPVGIAAWAIPDSVLVRREGSD